MRRGHWRDERNEEEDDNSFCVVAVAVITRRTIAFSVFFIAVGSLVRLPVRLLFGRSSASPPQKLAMVTTATATTTRMNGPGDGWRKSDENVPTADSRLGALWDAGFVMYQLGPLLDPHLYPTSCPLFRSLLEARFCLRRRDEGDQEGSGSSSSSSKGKTSMLLLEQAGSCEWGSRWSFTQ